MIKSSKPAASRTQEVYEQLRNDLLTCRLAPGVHLKVHVLAAKAHVSVGIVREALSRLTSEGLVVSEPQKGFRVTPISVEDLRDLIYVRQEIETFCLRRSMEVGDLQWESEVVSAHHRLSRTPWTNPDSPEKLSDEWVRVHADFHRALASGCRSPWSIRIREQLYDQGERYRRLSFSMGDRTTRDVDREHREIVEATLARDTATALALMMRHLQLTSSIFAGGQAASEGTSAKPVSPRQKDKRPPKGSTNERKRR